MNITQKDQPTIVEALGYLIVACLMLGLALVLFCVFLYALFGGFGPMGIVLAVLSLLLL